MSDANVTPIRGGKSPASTATTSCYNHDLERLVLGAVLQDPGLLDDARLRPRHFHAQAHAALWDFLAEYRSEAAGGSEPIAQGAWLPLVVDRRKAQPAKPTDPARWGLPAIPEILALPQHCPATDAYHDAEARLLEYARAREVLAACAGVSGALAEGEPPGAIVDRFVALAETLTIADARTRRGWAALSDVAIDAAEAAVRPTDGTRRSTGIDTLDAVLGGLRPADLVILGARPSMGKTALALHIALEVAASGGLVGIFSMEMSREALAHRALAHESGIAVHDIRGGNLGNHAAREVVAAAGRFGTLPLWIDDAVGLTVDAMAARVRRLAAMTGHEPALLVVDYLQLARAPVGRADNRERVVAEVSMGLKAIARAHRCTVLALAQLNRDATKRADNRPQVSDLRDSGQIEQDADAILLLHRPVVLDPNHPDPGEAELAVAKQRQGPTGVVMLRFDGRAQSFRADTVTREASPRPSAKPRSRGEDPYA